MKWRVAITGGHRTRNSRAKITGATALVMALLVTTSCTPEPTKKHVTDPVRVLQSVNVVLSSAASVETIGSNAISVDADGASSSEVTDFKVPDVIGDLPVRVTTQYQAGKKSGNNLADLKGYTGQVQINVTIENLTVQSKDITYDVAGKSHSNTALVGAPLTIAAATQLSGVTPDQVVSDSADSASGTNGLLSASSNGDAVVQWGTVLAPPKSGASTTLRLVADVKNFTSPTINLAIQPGLSADLSASGIFTSTFDNGPSTELALQKRTINLIGEVNNVLAQAGATITEVRTNLEASSDTIGTRTVSELQSNASSLAQTMKSVSGQVTSLGTDLNASTEATASSVTSQLKQTVDAMQSMLGDTSATPPSAVVKGQACQAVVDPATKSATVYGSLLTMSSQLNAYAATNGDCRDEVVNSLKTTIGPEKATPESCKDQTSLTCSLFSSAATVSAALIGLADGTNKQIDGLQMNALAQANTDYSIAATNLQTLQKNINNLIANSNNPDQGFYNSAMEQLTTSIKDTQSSLNVVDTSVTSARSSIDALHTQLQQIASTASKAQTDLGTSDSDKQSVRTQAQDLAHQLCTLTDGGNAEPGKLSQKDVDQLRSYLTSAPCNPNDTDGNPNPDLPAPAPYDGPLDQRLNAQASAWSSVLAQTDTTNADLAINTAFGNLTNQIQAVRSGLDKIESNRKVVDETVSSSSGNLTDLKVQVDALVADQFPKIGDDLTKASDEQVGLRTKVKELLTGFSGEASLQITELIAGKARSISETGTQAVSSVDSAFTHSISGMLSTANGMVSQGKDAVNMQEGKLQQNTAAMTAAIDGQTKKSLDVIGSSTGAATRDLNGASALLSGALNRVMLDLGSSKVNGSGLLGSMATSAAKADTADYQLALATQNAQGYANIRSQDVAGIFLQQAQFKESLDAANKLPAFHLNVPSGVTSQTLYTLSIGGGE